MKKLPKIMVFLMLYLLLWIGAGWCLPVTPSGDNLQGFFDDKEWGLDAVKDQVDVDYFTLTTGSTGSTMTLYHDESDYSFGIYNKLGEKAEVFEAGDTSVAAATVSFLPSEQVMVFQYWDNFNQLTDFVLVPFSTTSFGFYFSDTSGNTIYTDEDLNTGGEEKVLVYNIAPGAFVFAGELDGDGDYFDMVTHAESLSPIPEPATMLLFGVGLCGLALVGRKRLAKS